MVNLIEKPFGHRTHISRHIYLGPLLTIAWLVALSLLPIVQAKLIAKKRLHAVISQTIPASY